MAVASENAAMDSIVNLGEESSRESSRESSPPPQDSSTYFTPLSRPPRRNSLRSSSKIYSVSFQDCCCILHETTALEAKNRWRDAANFDEGPLNSPVIEIPRSADHFDRPDQSGDDDDEDEELDATDTSRIIAKTKSRRILSKSLDLKRGPNYNTIIGETSVSTSPKCKAPVVFCIHGNKYGVVKCCDSLSDENGHSHQDNAKLTGTINELSDEEASSSPRNRRHTSEQHCHTNTEGPTMDKKARNKLILASVLCLFFMTLEIIGGFLANSLAIATDAAHLMTDFASFMISLFSIYLASRPATRNMSFGWHRAEVIGATVSVLMIWVVTGILVYIAIERIVSGEYEIDATIMLITSGVGVLVNIIMGCTLHQHGHGHSHGGSSGGHGHGHSHGDPENAQAEQEKENINVRAAFIHVLGDFLQSLGVFIAAIIIYFRPDLVIIDPICTFIFSVLVLFTTIRILKDTMIVLMEGIPRDVSFTVVQDTFLEVEGIVAVHNLRIWGLTTDKTALAVHLAIAPGFNAQDILKVASTRIRAKYPFFEMTLQVEEFEEDMDDCNQCKAPET